ncbi:MAG TPA: hypothetical protein VFA15_01920 [Nitrososphaera sp.]|nr:hypothetical protein [Nitrososphaera sp.]
MNLEQNGHGWAAGIFWSIVFMLSALFSVMGFVVAMILKDARRSRPAQLLLAEPEQLAGPDLLIPASKIS